MPIWTVHESIMTTQEHAALVLDVMRQTFADIGNIPAIKVQYHDDFERSPG